MTIRNSWSMFPRSVFNITSSSWAVKLDILMSIFTLTSYTSLYLKKYPPKTDEPGSLLYYVIQLRRLEREKESLKFSLPFIHFMAKGVANCFSLSVHVI